VKERQAIHNKTKRGKDPLLASNTSGESSAEEFILLFCNKAESLYVSRSSRRSQDGNSKDLEKRRF
jgi:hypothetical protein